MEIIKKAWEVTDPTIPRNYYDEQYMWEIVYAESAGKAKLKLIDRETDDYLKLKARRAKQDDIVLHKGSEIKRSQLEREIREMERVNNRRKKIMLFPENELFYVQNGYVGNSVSWWRLENKGYTCDLNYAQKYTRAEILKNFIPGRHEDRIWAASHVEKHIRQHVDGQYLDNKFTA